MRVELQQLERQSRAVGDLGEDLAASVGRWRDALAAPCAPSVRAVCDAWEREFSVHIEVLRAWSEAARAATAAYRAADTAADTAVGVTVESRP